MGSSGSAGGPAVTVSPAIRADEGTDRRRGAPVTQFDIAVVGGTGPQGRRLGDRWARHGHRVFVGSRSAERAEATAAEILERVPDARVSGASNADAAAQAEVVVLAVPYEGHDELVASLAEPLTGKVVVSCVNPLGFDKQGPYALDVPEAALRRRPPGWSRVAGSWAPSTTCRRPRCGSRTATSSTRTCSCAATTRTRRRWRS